jgi:RND family efflux transporter MFP subunit
MKHKKWWIGSMLVLTMSLTACSTKEAALAVDNRIAVKTASAEATMISDGFRTLGTVRPADILTVTPAIGGIVQSVYVRDGAYVEAGDILYVLDDDTAQSNFEATVSSLKTTRDNLSIQLKDAESQLADVEALYAVGAATVSALETAQSQTDSLTKQYENAATAYREQVNILSAGIADYTVKSPVEGIVSGFDLAAGERVTTQTATTIIQSSGSVIKTALTFEQLKQLDQVERIEVILGEKTLSAAMETLNFLQNETTKLYDVTLSLTDTEDMLLDGIACEIEFLKPQRTASTLPVSAIKYIGEDQYAFYVQDSAAVRIPVVLGSVVGDRIEIIQLPDGLQWIISGIDQIQDGTEVKTIE